MTARELWVGQPMHLVVGTAGQFLTFAPGHKAVTRSKFETACGLVVSHLPRQSARVPIGRWPTYECCGECIAIVKQTTHPIEDVPTLVERGQSAGDADD